MHASIISTALLALITLIPSSAAMNPNAVAAWRPAPDASFSLAVRSPAPVPEIVATPSRRMLRQATRDEVVTRSKRPVSAKRAETSAQVAPEVLPVTDVNNGCYTFTYVANKFGSILSTSSTTNEPTAPPIFLTFVSTVDQNTAIQVCAQQAVSTNLGYYSFNVYYSNVNANAGAGGYICQIQYYGSSAVPFSNDLNLADPDISSSLLYTNTNPLQNGRGC